jgi:nicotinamidase-related amidase
MKKTLIVVDMQNDFIHMALGTPEAVAIVPRVKAKIEACRDAGYEIIYTRDTHGPEYLSTPEGKKLPVEHCIRGSKGWEIAEGLYIPGCKIIDKPNFGWPHWDQEVLEDVELIGLCTDICVVSNALIIKATFPDAAVKVDKSCCAGVTPESHEAALTTMQMCQIDIVGA